MRKKVVLYTIFCCAIIVGLAAFLVYKVNSKSNYANSIKLNCPGEITILVNTQIKLLDGFINVKPDNFDGQISAQSYAGKKENENSYSFNFENKSFIAYKEGYYYIELSAPKSVRSTATCNLKIHAVENEEINDVTLNKTTLTVGEQIPFNELFSLKNDMVKCDIKIENENVIQYANGVFTAISSGTCNLTATITKSYGYVQYDMSYKIVVNSNSQHDDNIQDNEGDKGDENLGGNEQEKPGGDEQENPPKTNLIINITKVDFDNDICAIQFKIFDGNVAASNQAVDVEVDENYLSVQSKTAPFIYLQILKNGLTRLTFKSKENPSISIILEIDTNLKSYKILS